MRSFTATTLLLALFSMKTAMAAPLGAPMDYKAVEKVATSNLQGIEEALTDLSLTNAHIPPPSTFRAETGGFRLHAPPRLHVTQGRPVYDAADPKVYENLPATPYTPHPQVGRANPFPFKGSEYDAVVPSGSAHVEPQSPSALRFRNAALTALKKERFKKKGSSPLRDMTKKQSPSFANVVEMALEQNKLERQGKITPEQWKEVMRSPTRDGSYPSEDTSRFKDADQGRFKY
ncbi:uncharacterized protein UTRI_06547_B [Ustilago trichophora]|uniref:Uncharacterized protein n=1 Tax=Ustilago trichophora TaxID=86804 RepID=A0A5C3EPT0_9BASI|nr:uncharacterized protein UTRI_06547_B [Ustilago trichophora]